MSWNFKQIYFELYIIESSSLVSWCFVLTPWDNFEYNTLMSFFSHWSFHCYFITKLRNEFNWQFSMIWQRTVFFKQKMERKRSSESVITVIFVSSLSTKFTPACAQADASCDRTDLSLQHNRDTDRQRAVSLARQTRTVYRLYPISVVTHEIRE